MANYHTTVSGTKSLAAIQSAINGEEALASKFVKSQLTAVDGAITNLLTFREETAVPKAVKLTLSSAAVPANHSLVWSGVMLVAGSNALVSLYRAN